MAMKTISPLLQKLLIIAQEEGRKCGSVELLPEHVLLAMIKSSEGLGFITLKELNLNILPLQVMIEKNFSVNPGRDTQISELPPSIRLRALIDVAAMEANALRNEYVGSEHILIASSREEDSTSHKFFSRAGISSEDIRNAVRTVQSHFTSSYFFAKQANKNPKFSQAGQGPMIPAQGPFERRRQNASFLAEYSRDLTALSREGKLDPVVGREKELKRLVQILSRRTKNNPVLVGEPGVGKTAVVEALAQKIAQGQVPYYLLKKRILSLDLAALVAGTKYRGEFEDRMKRMMKEIREDGNIIIFIDELHTIIGAGGPEGAMDASNILKPALSRGEIQIVGATTLKEYRKYFEKDSALERRFQVVKVDEPDVKDTEAILNGLKGKYEEFHGVIYDEDVIPSIVKFSERYIPERFLPDKAIDILDEAGSAKKISEEERPQELAELEKAIENLSNEKKELVATQNYEKAAEVRDKVRDLKRKFDEFSNYWQNHSSLAKKHVTVDDVCQIISSITGIPLEQLDSNESKRLLHMEDELHKSVIGQDEAVKLLSGAIRRSRSGVSSGDRPMGSFIFLGPTGVGKTQLAKTLAKFLFGTEDALIRIDMSDYMEKHNASRLVGAPPGYVGFDEGGVLTEKVRHHPYSVVLLDEIEKAHPDVFNLLLQLLEEGELSDNLGHTVNFRNTVIIMTSNAGARQITTEHRLGFSSIEDGTLPYGQIKANALEELKRLMSPELLNRIDDVVVFDALNKKQIASILDIQLGELMDRLADKNLTISVTKKAREYLIQNGYEPSMGARPMRRIIQKEIEDQLSLLLLENPNPPSNNIVVDMVKQAVKVEFDRPKHEKVAKTKKTSKKQTVSQIGDI